MGEEYRINGELLIHFFLGEIIGFIMGILMNIIIGFGLFVWGC